MISIVTKVFFMKFFYRATTIIIVSLLSAGCITEDGGSGKAYILGNKKRSVSDGNKMKTTNETGISKTTIDPYKRARIEYSIKLAELKHQEKMASIAAEKEKSIKRMEYTTQKEIQNQQAKIKELETRKRLEMSREREKEAYRLDLARNETRQKYIIAALAALVLILIFLYILYRKSVELRKKEIEEKFRHEKYLLESRQHHERVSKIIDMVADRSIDNDIRHDLTLLLKENNSPDSRLLENGSEKNDNK